jgi:hypothetical protein
MDNEPDYQPLRKEADLIHHRFCDRCDDMNHQFAQWIKQESKLVVQDIDAKRPPHSIESRILQIENRLKMPRQQEMSVMTPHDARTMVNEYEQLRVHLRQMPNYV